jgi:DNA-nicking Smr family endonuclease
LRHGLLELEIDATAWIGASWDDDIPAVVPAAWLDRPTLDDGQRKLLALARTRKISQLNLRLFDRREALRHLELFVPVCAARRVRLCRVIPGKGVESRGEPVLKRLVLEWCRGPGRELVRGWAPELDGHGEWGSMVLLLRSPRRPTRS